MKEYWNDPNTSDAYKCISLGDTFIQDRIDRLVHALRIIGFKSNFKTGNVPESKDG